MMSLFDASAIGSDIARSRMQFAARLIAKAVVAALGLNRAGLVATEIVQAIRPTTSIRTKHGVLSCRTGHGRLRWRALTFHTEEPETVAWLDEIGADDFYWDVGANVGLYAIYVSAFRHCPAIAFEPEAQNYALLIENIALNRVGHLCEAACLAVSDISGLGELRVPFLTKGGAYNSFCQQPEQTSHSLQCYPVENVPAGQPDNMSYIRQRLYGASLDDLLVSHHIPPPTHLKIDVDGLEPRIIAGAQRLLGHPRLRSILIEINRNSADDLKIPRVLEDHGFRLVSARSNWQSRINRVRESEMPTVNMRFDR